MMRRTRAMPGRGAMTIGEPEIVVLDASVGVKWFLDEPGSDDARALLVMAADGEIRLAAPVHFAHEVLAVVRRTMGPNAVLEAWECLEDSGVVLLPLTTEVVSTAARQCEALSCSLYDALAPACADVLGATLVSADRRAHSAYPGVRLIGV